MTDTNVKYRLMEAKRIEIFTLVRTGFQENRVFKAGERQQNDYSSDATRLQASEFLKGCP